MRRILLALVAALALAVGANVATSAADGGAQATAKKNAAKKKAGKKKAAKCKTAKKKGKAKKGKGKGKARKSLADSAAKKKAKGKAKKGKKKGCAKPKAKPKPKRRFVRKHTPYEERLIEKFRERRESRPKPTPQPTIQDMVPADGTYTAAAAPGLTVTISGNSTTARVVYTVPKAQFSALCQDHVTGDGVLVDVTGPFAPSQSTKRGYLQLFKTEPQKSWTVSGSIGKDGSFTLSANASFAYPPDPGATCSGSSNLSGTLVR